MANTIARLGVRLGIDSAEFAQGIEAAKKKLGEFAEKAEVMGKVGIAAFAAMTYKALEFADSIADVAKANDVAIATVLQLGEALQQNGGDAENAGKLLAGFTKFVDNAAEGSYEAQKSFAKAGIGLKELGKLTTEELFKKTVKGLAEIQDPLTRNAKAMEIFGKAAKGVDWIGMAEGLARTSHLTQQQADAIKDAGDAWDMLHAKSHDAMVAFSVGVGPSVKAIIEYYDELMGKTELFAETVKHISQTIAVLVADTMYVFTGIGRELVHTYENAKLVMTGAFEEARKQNEAFEKENEKRAIRMAEVQNKILGLGFDTNGSSSYDAGKTKDATGRNVIKGLSPEEKKAEAERLKFLHFNIQQRQKEGKEIEDNTRRVQEAYASESMRQDVIARTLKDQQEMFVLGLQYRHMRTEDVQLSKDLLDIEQKRNNNIREIKLNTDLNLAAQTDLIDRENRLATEAERLARARKEMNEELRRGTFGEGFQRSMADYFRNAKTEMETGMQAFDSVMGNMNAALDNFVRTGKLSFKDLARSIIQDLIAINLKAQATAIFKGMGFGFSGGGVDSLFQGSANYSGGFGGYAAEGGDISANTTYMVGERGPELFVPKSNGTVIPNNMLNSMGSNQPSVTYNGPYIANMSAIDTQSATQFLAKNKSAVWAANQTAQRSLPQSR
jgi:lambda family phage tail tape measure protein